MSIRSATHAGSWYKDSGSVLSAELDSWLDKVVDRQVSPNARCPVSDARVIIAPHAGYSYSGPAAAWAYKALDLSNIKRVFILGPSHHVYLTTCALSTCDEYKTPLGNLKLDKDCISELAGTKKFSRMNINVDEDEHSIEMHLPYTYKILERAFPAGNFPPIVPILVGSISTRQEREYGEVLRPYIENHENVFIVSSDFCHWGSRFQYQAYRRTRDSPLSHLHTYSGVPPGDPIHKSIEDLDREGMNAIETGSHDAFATYLQKTKNTICGRHPIGVVMAGLERLAKERDGKGIFKFVRYEQSSQVTRSNDSSVSYASAYART